MEARKDNRLLVTATTQPATCKYRKSLWLSKFKRSDGSQVSTDQKTSWAIRSPLVHLKYCLLPQKTWAEYDINMTSNETAVENDPGQKAKGRPQTESHCLCAPEQNTQYSLKRWNVMEEELKGNQRKIKKEHLSSLQGSQWYTHFVYVSELRATSCSNQYGNTG